MMKEEREALERGIRTARRLHIRTSADMQAHRDQLAADWVAALLADKRFQTPPTKPFR